VRIAVVDHGAGNLVSIAQGLERAGAEVIVADTPDALAGVDGVVLPGVGPRPR
jgi:imidazole glycerol-phosphate synthase subunit HisH